MEHAQRGYDNINRYICSSVVLILILMEHAQRVKKQKHLQKIFRLNPYFNGTCSNSTNIKAKENGKAVLILILMEHAQRVFLHLRACAQRVVS